MGANAANLVALLHDSIMSLNSKFDKFNETVSTKIDNIERNYDDLNAKIDRLAHESQTLV